MNQYKGFILTAKRGFSKPDILYHGTSSEFLRSILKHGLSTLKAKEGRWVNEDEDAKDIQRSRRSYGGIYFTPNVMTARSSASNFLIKKYGNWQNVPDNVNSLVVCVQIQPRSTLPDEDNYSIRISNFMHESYYPFILIRQRLNVHDKESVDIMNKSVNSMIDRYVKNPDQRKDIKVLRSLAKEVFLTEIERQFAHKSKQVDKTLGAWSSEYKLKSAYHRIIYPKQEEWEALPRKLRPENTAKAEASARKALDLFIRKTRGSSVDKLNDSSERTWTNVRTETPITFKGRNKIICIIEEIKQGDTKLFVHYGRIPEDYLKQYRERISSKFEIEYKGELK